MWCGEINFFLKITRSFAESVSWNWLMWWNHCWTAGFSSHQCQSSLPWSASRLRVCRWEREKLEFPGNFKMDYIDYPSRLGWLTVRRLRMSNATLTENICAPRLCWRAAEITSSIQGTPMITDNFIIMVKCSRPSEQLEY